METLDLINKLQVNIVYHDNTPFSDTPVKQLSEKSDYYYDRFIADTIKNVFFRFSSERINVDKLSIDLGKISPEDIPFRLSNALESELKKHISLKPATHFIARREEKINTKQTIDTAKESEPVDLFLDYLKNPQKPWYISSVQTYNIDKIVEKAMKLCLSGQTDNTNYFFKLLTLISRNRTAFKRFTGLMNNYYMDKVLEKYIIASENGILPNTTSDTIGEETAKDSFEKAILLSLDFYKRIKQEINSFPESRKKQIRIDVLQYLLYGKFDVPAIQKQIKELYLDNVWENKNQKTFAPDRYESDKDQPAKRIPVLLSKPFRLHTHTHSDRKKKAIRAESLQHHSFNKRETATTQEKSGLAVYDIPVKEDYLEPVTERIPVTNAGLVVLAPFLVMIFSRLNYLENNKMFRTEKYLLRAVHLLQLLTGEKGKHHEYLLPLNKIICGIHPGFPVDPFFRATKKEKEETEGMLISAIEHWKGMEGTSVAGLQETFIRRDGLIENCGTDWIVRVENKGVDILLNDLPWSISTLALPWNNYKINVEWKR